MGNWSIDSVVNTVMKLHDHNRDGVIDLTRPTDQALSEVPQDESVYLRGMFKKRPWAFDRLLLAADKDGDKRVTREELSKTVAVLDVDLNGKLKMSITGQGEGRNFLRKYGSRNRK